MTKTRKISHIFLLIIILGKLWILQQTSNSSAKSQIISQYILKK